MTVSAPPVAAPSTQRSSRTGWMDLTRVVAIAAVVLIHTTARVVSGAEGAELAQPRWWLGNVLDSSCRAAVPLFLMVSGALMLVSGRPETLRDFYLRRLQRVGVPLVFWSMCYLAFRRFVVGQDIGIEQALGSLAHGRPYFHLYFLFIMVGLYLATPLLRMVLAFASRRSAVGLCAGLLTVGCVDQFLMSFLGAGQPNAVTLALPYVGYFVAGHLLATWTLPAGAMKAASATFLGATGTTALGTWYLAQPDGWSARASYLYDYLSPTVIAASIAAFVLIRALPTRFPALENPRITRATHTLSTLSFGVYLMHPAVQYLYQSVWPAEVYPAPASELLGAIVLQWTTVFVGTVVLTAVLRRIPVARRVL